MGFLQAERAQLEATAESAAWHKPCRWSSSTTTPPTTSAIPIARRKISNSAPVIERDGRLVDPGHAPQHTRE